MLSMYTYCLHWVIKYSSNANKEIMKIVGKYDMKYKD